MILDEPTRGIDVNSKREIYLIINELAKNDVAIILISSDLLEIVGLSDKVLVMHEGEVKGLLKGKEIEQNNIMQTALKDRRR